MAITPEMRGTAPMGVDGFDEAPRLNCQPGAQFLLMAHPGAGEVVTKGLKKPTWLPILAPLPITPGIELVEIRRRGDSFTDTIRAAIQKKEAEGFTIIWPQLAPVVDAEHLPAGVAPASEGRYYRRYDVYDRRTKLEGSLYKEVWFTRLRSRSPNDPPRWTFHKEPYYRWLASLVEAGIIPGPDEFARAEYLKHHRSWAAQQANIDDPAKRADRVKAAAEKAKVMEAAAVLDAVDESKPKRGRR